MKKITASCFFFFALILVLPLGASFAADKPIVTDEDSLFGDDASGSVQDSSSPVKTPADNGIESVGVSSSGSDVSSFLKTSSVRVGGKFAPYLQANWLYRDPWSGDFSIGDPDYQSLVPCLPALVFIDARPKEDFRVYFSVKANWPFTSSTASSAASATGLSSSSSGYVKVFELFSDFNLNDTVFFRFGKQSVKWGVGYFFSPADLINLSTIDVTDPTAQREGPVALRVNVPIPARQDNIWAYAIVPSEIAPAALKPEDIGFAGKYELVVGGWEIGAGGIYQKSIDPRLMLTASGSIYTVGLFGEAVTAIDPDADDAGDRVRFSGTAGFNYTNSDLYLTLIGQYYYNGEATVESRKQYAALSLSDSHIFTDDVTAGVLVISNVSDLSFMVQPTLSWAWLDYATLSFSPVFTFATDELWGKGKSAEYVAATGGPAMTLSVKVVLGSGNF
jgi:hypothetical protein